MWFCNECFLTFEEPVFERDVIDGWKSVDLCTCPCCEGDEIEEVTEEEAEQRTAKAKEWLEEEGEPFTCYSCKTDGYYIPTPIRHAKFSRAICLECGTMNFIKKGE